MFQINFNMLIPDLDPKVFIDEAVYVLIEPGRVFLQLLYKPLYILEFLSPKIK
jgi:hypothetical protein